MYYSYYEYTMTLDQVNINAETSIGPDRYHLEDQPYDMFCIPYSDNLEIYKNGVKLFNSNKSLAINMAIEIGADSGTDNIYDIQLLPYCPVRYCIRADGTFDIGDVKVNYITTKKDSDSEEDENIGIILYLSARGIILSIIFEKVQYEPVRANPIVFLSSINHTSNSSTIFKTVSLTILPAVYGETLPGSDNSHSTFLLSLSASSKSTPPGFDARSIMSTSFFVAIRHFKSITI
jgi:hypothetical protein